jgi:hypothetical protein
MSSNAKIMKPLCRCEFEHFNDYIMTSLVFIYIGNMLGNVTFGNDRQVIIHWVATDNGNVNLITEHDRHKQKFVKSLLLIRIIEKIIIIQRNYREWYYAYGNPGYDFASIRYEKERKNLCV